jgi:hypothetical protein
MAADTDLQPVRPEGPALALFVTTVILSILCTIVVFLRTYIRTRNQCIGTDDYLMCAGWVSLFSGMDSTKACDIDPFQVAYMVHNIIVIIGCHRGVGTVRRKLETSQVQGGMKVSYSTQTPQQPLTVTVCLSLADLLRSDPRLRQIEHLRNRPSNRDR